MVHKKAADGRYWRKKYLSIATQTSDPLTNIVDIYINYFRNMWVYIYDIKEKHLPGELEVR